MTIFDTAWNLYGTIANFLVPLPSPEQSWRHKVAAQLSNHDISASQIIDLLSENPKLKRCYAISAGVVEGYTVGQHTEMVLELAQRYREYFKSLICKHLEWGEFLLFLALHDIGKGMSRDSACIASHPNVPAKELELLISRSIVTETLEGLEIRSSKGHIFQALLMYDSQGDYLKGNLDADDYKKHLLDMSAVCRLSPLHFYQLYSTFHLIDAASYPNLHPLFVFESQSLRHCEGNQLTIDFFIDLLGKESQ